MNNVKPNVFVSACLEFESCRFDGTMISDDVVRRMKDVVNFIRVCPELSIGLTAPREAVRLVKRKGEHQKLLGSVHGVDYTEKMENFTSKYLEKLLSRDIDGFLLKAKSPTCGIGDVKVYQDIGKAQLDSARHDGMFGTAIKERFPDHPIETERRISNYNIRESFFTHVFTMASFREMKHDFSYKKFVEFHTKNKYLFMSYNQAILKDLGQILANHEKLSHEEVLQKYETQLRKLLHGESSKKRRINTLTHIYGYFKKDLTTEEKEYYFNALDDYIDYRIPYSNVLYILKGFAVRFQEEYLLQQTVFQPFPKELLVVLDSGNKI
ncbi:YbgA family protein [Candidatus Xianfuyuplasma coldseepsis]|uniref:DUF523 and DUF1722 domain-containing protein n=1 Tax=Candidatus Xianfuyuplasma coldseepsis TaxID=2782163 RepID=A0A7L7KR80_9MOLU|nr:DUF523 and DUF1722 domain-containing protein [Xianfuyuplasma coldseepsis]QMS85331.1 DUF523 and DUF1722 domain-containing protein [Xianfuyuplasma coldseepsis]